MTNAGVKVRQCEAHRSNGFQPLDVGAYTGYQKEQRATDVPCPFCRRLLTESIPYGRAYRVTRVVKRHSEDHALVEGHELPRTHRLLGCRDCCAVFTSPKRGTRKQV